MSPAGPYNTVLNNAPGEKSCSRCGQQFTCRMDDITQCQCSVVKLTAEARAFMAASFSDCLCKNCLVEMNAAAVAGLKK